MHFSISSKPVVSNSHNRHRADTEGPASRKHTKDEIQPLSNLQSLPDHSTFRLLNQLTTKQYAVTKHMMEWLSEQDMLQLTGSDKQHQLSVNDFYNSRMKLKLPYQPDPLPLRYPFKSDPSARWTIVPGSLRSWPLRNDDGVVIAMRHDARLQRHDPDQNDPAELQFRPLFGPNWKIDSIARQPAADSTYTASLKPIGAEFNYPAYLYRDPRNRLDRYVPTDPLGLHYLSVRLILHPLTKRIRNEPDMSVAMAQQVRESRGQEILDALNSVEQSPAQKELLKNPLFAEHVECGRIDVSAVRNLADNEMNLFYCLSLLPLFRSGTLQLTDVSVMPESAIRLLHDPRLARLFCNGVLNKAQLQSLTPTQYKSIGMLYHPLMQRHVSPQRVLALQDDQIARLRKAGLLDDLSKGQIALSTALWHAQREEQTPSTAGTTLTDLNRKRKFQPAPELWEACSSSSSSSSGSSTSSSWSSSSWSSSSSSSSRPLVSPARLNSSTRLSISSSGTISREPAQRPRAATMALTDVAQLISKWPVDAVRKALSDAHEQRDVKWIAAFQRVSALLPDLLQIAIPDFEVSTSSSSFTLDSSPKSLLTGRSLKSTAGPVRRQDLISGENVVSLADVALLLGRMSPELFRAVIYADGSGGNADWVARFGQIIHLMPVEKIIGFLNAKVKDSGLFDSLDNGLDPDEVAAFASAFNQIHIHLAQHLNGTDYLTLAMLFLKNEIGFMIAEAITHSRTNIIYQCAEIWSLVQTKCEITGQSVSIYFAAALSSISDAMTWRSDAWGEGFGTGREIPAAAFASFLINMNLMKDETFLKLWTNNIFNEEVDFDSLYRNLLGELGGDFSAIWHALFSACRQSSYGDRCFRLMSNALHEENGDGPAEVDEVE